MNQPFTPAEPVLELRVHGIGNHDYLSALGSPPLESPDGAHSPDVVDMPTLPNHCLRLVNWSRTSRGLAKFLWYFALPFTFINVAAYMGPRRQPGRHSFSRLFLHFATLVTGVLLTLVAQCWSIAIVETALRRITVTDRFNEMWVVWTITAILVGGILLRIRVLRTRPPNFAPPILWVSSALNIVAVIGMTLVLNLHPAQQTAPELPSVLSLWTVLSPKENAVQQIDQREFRDMPAATFNIKSCLLMDDPDSRYLFARLWDPMNVVLLGSLAMVALLALGLLGFALVAREPTDRSGLAGAALFLVSGVMLLHAGASSIMLGLDWLLTYLDNFPSLGIIDLYRGERAYDRVLLAYQNNECQLSARLIYNFPVYALLAAASFAVSVIAVNLVGPEATLPHFRGIKGYEYVHRLVANLRSRLLWALPLATVLGGVTAWGLFALSLPGPDRHWLAVFLVDLVVILSHVGALLAIAFVVLYGNLAGIRTALGFVADVAGFWPVAWHPLAGRSYRYFVARGIERELARPGLQRVALVGHSQGSVICAWVTARRTGNSPRIDLVTCGSPLQSLYEAFFPNEFNEGTFSIIARRTHSWANFWRKTDPIATPIGSDTTTTNYLLNDPLPGSRTSHPNGHGNYWTDPTQLAHIETQLNDPPSA